MAAKAVVMTVAVVQAEAVMAANLEVELVAMAMGVVEWVVVATMAMEVAVLRVVA